MTLLKPRLSFHKISLQVTGIVYKVEEFRSPVSVTQCYNCQSFCHSAKNCRSEQKCLIYGENDSHKGCPNRVTRKPECTNCKGPHVAKGVRNTKQAFRQHVVNNKKTYASTVSQNTLSQPKTNETFTFTAKQLTKFVANVVTQIAQPQVCYPNPNQDTLDLKSTMGRKASNATKTILNVDITGKDLFESIGTLHIHEHQSQPSLRKHPKSIHSASIHSQVIRLKRKKLELYLKENIIDVIALNETFLSKKHNFRIPGYDTIRKTTIQLARKEVLPSL